MAYNLLPNFQECFILSGVLFLFQQKKKKKSLIDLQEFFSFEMLLFQQKTVKSKISKNH